MISRMCPLYISWVSMTLSIFSILHVSADQEMIVFVNEHTKTKNWEKAQEECSKNYDGYLADSSVFLNQANEVPVCARSTYWIGNIDVVTPFVSVEGCFNYSSVYVDDVDVHNLTNNSVEQCAVLCGEGEFLMQAQQCMCLAEDHGFHDQQINASLCDHKCRSGTQFCGGDSVVNKYSFLHVDPPLTSSDMCFFTSCGEHSSDKCTAIPTATNLLCNVTGVEESPWEHFIIGSNVGTWSDAMNRCIDLEERYPVTSYTSDICNHGHDILDSSAWTSTKKYQGDVYTFETPSTDFTIKECSFVNLTSDPVLRKESTCRDQGGSRKLNFACVADPSKVDTDNDCFMMVESNPTERSTTVGTVTTSFDPSNTDHTEGSSTHITPTEDMSNQKQINKKDDEGAAIGPVIGGVVAGVIVIAGLIAVFVFFKRRRAFGTKDNVQKNSSSNTNTNQSKAVSSDNVYLDMKEGEYDHLHTKRKQISDNGTDTQVYDTSTPNEYGKLERQSEGNSKKSGQNNSESTDYAYSHIKGTSSQPPSGNEYDYSSHNRTVDHKNGFNTYDSCS